MARSSTASSARARTRSWCGGSSRSVTSSSPTRRVPAARPDSRHLTRWRASASSDRFRLMSAARTTTATIPVEIASWITKFIGGDGSGRRVLDEALTSGSTVRSVLTGLSARYPELHRALWHGNELGEHIEVLVNNAVLGIEHTLDSPLKPGDQITLLAQFMGGS